MPNNLETFLANPDQHWDGIIALFNAEILPHVLQQLNQNISLRQIAKLEEERLPENERNLTDARTRIGILLEYSLGICLDDFLGKALGPDYHTGFVVTNKYPDLILRDSDHKPLLRLEVKCIQTAAEEKSANCDALIRDIHPGQDLLCVLIWEWESAGKGRSVIEYPRVHRGYVFDAYSLAKVRDRGWLNAPKPGKTNDIDVSSAVVCQDNLWKKEEKNLGKLMRIADRNALESPPLQEFADEPAVAEYLRFKAYAIDLALRQKIGAIFKKAGYTAISWSEEIIRFDRPSLLCSSSGPQELPIFVYFSNNLRWTLSLRLTILRDLETQGINRCRVIVMGEKFAWLLSEFQAGKWDKPFGNKKPGPLAEVLRH